MAMSVYAREGGGESGVRRRGRGGGGGGGGEWMVGRVLHVVAQTMTSSLGSRGVKKLSPLQV